MKKGLVIAFPTDTIYGIATPYDDQIGLERINEIKNRSQTQRVAVLCDSIDMIEGLSILHEKARILINAFMPGPFTIILKANEDYIKKTKEDTVGVRIPNHKLALEVIKKHGPLKTTSVNVHNEPPINDYKTINDKFYDKIDLVYEGTIIGNMQASTVIDFTGDDYIILREGFIAKNRIDSVLNNKK